MKLLAVLALAAFANAHKMMRMSTPKDDSGENVMCAEPMCSNMCTAGYKTNEMGCMTCDCMEAPCEIPCEERRQVCMLMPTRNCSNFMLSCPPQPRCGPRPLCDVHQEKFDQNEREMMSPPKPMDEPAPSHHFARPECQDGSFKPTQCDDEREYCWCVDDRGMVRPDTIVQMFPGTPEPRCTPKTSMEMTINFRLDYSEEDLEIDTEELNGIVHSKVREWLLIETEDITYIEITPNNEMKAVNVRVIVIYSGSIDLPSAEHHMKEKLADENTVIPYHDDELKPSAPSMDTHHTYYEPPFSL